MILCSAAMYTLLKKILFSPTDITVNLGNHMHPNNGLKTHQFTLFTWAAG